MSHVTVFAAYTLKYFLAGVLLSLVIALASMIILWRWPMMTDVGDMLLFIRASFGLGMVGATIQALKSYEFG